MVEWTASPIITVAVSGLLAFFLLVSASAWLRGLPLYAATVAALSVSLGAFGVAVARASYVNASEAVAAIALVAMNYVGFLYIVSAKYLTATDWLDTRLAAPFQLRRHLEAQGPLSRFARFVVILPTVAFGLLAILVAAAVSAKTY